MFSKRRRNSYAARTAAARGLPQLARDTLSGRLLAKWWLPHSYAGRSIFQAC
jgi:hypothetical protein